MVVASRAYHDKLLDIGFIARSMKSLCGVDPHRHPFVSNENTITVPPLFLPSPDAIISLLLSQGCPQMAAQTLSNTFLRSAYQTQAKFEANYRETCTKLAPYLMSDPAVQAARYKSLASLVESQYQDQISTIKDLALERFKVHQNRSAQKNTAKTKPTFNQEYVPLLEKYFEYNAYPSAPDRLALARKSMMTPRQIEVWFQNHRNRSKKEGRTLRRLTSDTLPIKLSLESLEETMPFFVIPEEERKDPIKDNITEEQNGTTIIPQTPFTFSDTAPPHAFPTPYFSTSLPTKRCIFPTPVWMRSCSIIRPPRMIPTMEDIIADFTLKLVFSEPSSKQRGESLQSSAMPKLPWFAATHTFPPPAPHPAFIPVPAGRTSTSLITMSPSRLHSSPPPSPTHHPTTTPMSNSNTTHRRVARLPKRIPKYRSVTRRGASPDTSEASSSPSASYKPSSRTSSLSSDSSYSRRPSSCSSASSTSSTLTTPVLSPIVLPENAPSPVSISGVDLQNLDDLFDDYPGTIRSLDGIDFRSFSQANDAIPTLQQKNVFQFEFKALTSF